MRVLWFAICCLAMHVIVCNMWWAMHVMVCNMWWAMRVIVCNMLFGNACHGLQYVVGNVCHGLQYVVWQCVSWFAICCLAMGVMVCNMWWAMRVMVCSMWYVVGTEAGPKTQRVSGFLRCCLAIRVMICNMWLARRLAPTSTLLWVRKGMKKPHISSYGQNPFFTYNVPIYGIFGREITEYTVIYGVIIRLWPTLHISIKKKQRGVERCAVFSRLSVPGAMPSSVGCGGAVCMHSRKRLV